MKKFLLFASIILLSLILVMAVCVIVVRRSMIHVRLPHGAVLHVLPHHRDIQTGGAVIICPGGGYSYLEKWYEGYNWFPYFYLHGYTPAMLEYRMPKHDYNIPMTDGAEAIRVMRKHAEEWHFNEHNVGIVGFSAGGHLASTMMVMDNDSVCPDFGILFYSVISMKKELTHIDSHHQLLGEDASEQLENRFSNELHVSENTPPAFIAVANDDKAVSPRNSVLFRDAMYAKNRPVELHVYPSGGHGWASHLTAKYRGQVLDDLAEWLSNRQEELKCH